MLEQQALLPAAISAAVSLLVSLLSAFFLWRNQARGKRRQEVAEAALIGCREALDAIAWCLLETEGYPDPRPAVELSDRQRENRFAEFELMAERLKASARLIAELQTHRLRCEIHVGIEAAQDIQRIRDLFLSLRQHITKGQAAGRTLTHIESVLASGDGAQTSAPVTSGASCDRNSLADQKLDATKRLEDAYDALFSDNSQFLKNRLEAHFQSLEQRLKPAIRYH